MMKNTIAALCACAVGMAAPQAGAGITTYTPLVFGPLDDPGSGAYWTHVYDISADGRTYVGFTSNNRLLYANEGTLLNMEGAGGPFALTPDGQTAVGGVAGSAPQRWDLSNATPTSVTSTPMASTHNGAPLNQPARGTNRDVNAFGVSTPTGVVVDGALRRANDPFLATDISAFAGAYRGMAVDAPVSVVLGFIPGVNATAFRWNYETDEIQPLTTPAGASTSTVNGTGSHLSYDGSIVGGAARVGALNAPAYWDADGVGHVIPSVGGRVFGTMTAVSYDGLYGGGLFFGAGLSNNAFLYDFTNDVTYNLNELFADQIPEGWILTNTVHISDGGERIFAQALAPDGSQRFVLLEGIGVPAPGALGLFAGAAALRRRRRA